MQFSKTGAEAQGRQGSGAGSGGVQVQAGSGAPVQQQQADLPPHHLPYCTQRPMRKGDTDVVVVAIVIVTIGIGTTDIMPCHHVHIPALYCILRWAVTAVLSGLKP